MLRKFVAVTPIAGAILFPIVVPFSIAHFGISAGIIIALLLSCAWFISMLSTSEMPH